MFLFILVPRLDNSGPIKGAVALANGLVDDFKVTLVSLKGVKGEQELDKRVRVISLESKPWRVKLRELHHLLDETSQGERVTSISFCFSADVMNWMLKKKVRIISSVRSNLWKNYYHTYGFPGYFFALFHYIILRSFDDVVVLSSDMLKRLKKWGLNLHLIGNFIDEPRLEQYRSHSNHQSSEVTKLLFLGILNRRKRPDLLIRSAYQLKKEGREFHLLIAGDGPLASSLKQMIQDLNLSDSVTLLGHVDEPYSLLQQSDILVLPSESEGISRAVLEALYFGVPCIIRDIDGNRELIQSPNHGFLFKNDKDLVPVLNQALDRYSKNVLRDHLIPSDFSFEKNIKKFKLLLNNPLIN